MYSEVITMSGGDRNQERDKQNQLQSNCIVAKNLKQTVKREK